jgi:hypothetical protein
MGATHVRLAAANEDLLHGALQVAWKLRIDKNAKAGKKSAKQSKPTIKARRKR